MKNAICVALMLFPAFGFASEFIADRRYELRESNGALANAEEARQNKITSRPLSARERPA